MMASSIAFVAGVVLGFAASIPALGPLLALVAESGARRRKREGLELAIGGSLLVIGSGAWLTVRALLELGARGFTLGLN